MSECCPTTDYNLFVPRDYLNEYYRTVDVENEALLRFFAELARECRPESLVLDLGCGPTLYTLFSLARACAEIHMCDYLEANLAEIRRWLNADPDAFDWTPFTRKALELEAMLESSNDANTAREDIVAREALLRRKVTQVFKCDIRASAPLGIAGNTRYDLIVSVSCLEIVAHDLAEWREFLGHATSLLKPGGTLALMTLADATTYRSGERLFATATVNQSSLTEGLIDAGYRSDSIRVQYVPAQDPERSHYAGFLLSAAQKR